MFISFDQVASSLGDIENARVMHPRSVLLVRPQRMCNRLFIDEGIAVMQEQQKLKQKWPIVEGQPRVFQHDPFVSGIEFHGCINGKMGLEFFIHDVREETLL